jgi:hypothetical protein
MTLQYAPAGNLVINGSGYMPGGGPWLNSSDIRIKTVEGEYKTGLEDVAKLRPVNYTFKGNDTFEEPSHIATADGTKSNDSLTVPYPNSPNYQAAKDHKSFIGLIAQEVESIFPEMVIKRNGYIDGVAVTDLRDINTGPLVFALINAVIELKARVEVLEGA